MGVKIRVRTRTQIAAVATLPVLVVALLAGCAPSSHSGKKTPAPHHSATHSATATASETPSASPTPPPAATGTPVNIQCSQVLTDQQIYDFNPNFVSDDGSYSPKSGSLAASMKAAAGVACGWVNETSADEIEISIELPTAAALAAAKAAAAKGTPAPASGAEVAYFSESGGVGTTQLFQGSYWIAVASVDFVAPTDAQSISSNVVTNLRTAGG
jgi:hypothetical protein